MSVRTLRFYDRAGLLVPSERTEAGYRMYTDEDFPRLQQVLALKFLGLSLDEIKRCLAAGPRRLQESLGQQKAMMREKRAQLDAILQAIEEAERLLADRAIDLRVRRPRDRGDPDATAERLGEQVPHPRAAADHAGAVRAGLLRGGAPEARGARPLDRGGPGSAPASSGPGSATELKRLVAAGADPAGAEAQAWAGRFNGLISAFTQNDPEIEAGLKTWWKQHNELPAAEQPMGPRYTPEEQRS